MKNTFENISVNNNVYKCLQNRKLSDCLQMFTSLCVNKCLQNKKLSDCLQMFTRKQMFTGGAYICKHPNLTFSGVNKCLHTISNNNNNNNNKCLHYITLQSEKLIFSDSSIKCLQMFTK